MKKCVLFLIFIIILSFSCCFASNNFYDIKGTKYEGVVERIATLGIVNGVSDTTFAYNKPVTRAEMAKIMTLMYGLDADQDIIGEKRDRIFSDVKRSDWFYEYVFAAHSLGLLKGYEDGTFRPNEEVSYAEVVALMLRYLGYVNIKQDHPNGWYWNYIVKMREIDLNDNIGEFNYEQSAIRGDVVMFVWNSLITDYWGIVSENSIEGFTYSNIGKSPLETYFRDYRFIDNAVVTGLAGDEDGICIRAGYGRYATKEKVPLHVKGGRITALIKDNMLYGITFDEDYPNEKVICGPKKYVESQGYRLSGIDEVYSYGDKSEANYVYVVVNADTDKALRAVYLDSSDLIVVENISITKSGDDGDEFYILKINDKEYPYASTAVMRDSYLYDWKEIKENDCLVPIEGGLFASGFTTVSGPIEDITSNNQIYFAKEAYHISNNAKCIIYTEEEAVKFSSLSRKKLDSYIGVRSRAYLNMAEEVYILEFGKNDDENALYQVGYVVDVSTVNKDTQTLRVNTGSRMIHVTTGKQGQSGYFVTGDLVCVDKEEGEEKATLIDKDTVFKNDIGVKYHYEPQKITHSMIGDYMITEDTIFYTVTLKYVDNSVSSIETCTIKPITIEDDLSVLGAYDLILVHNEFMELNKVFLVSEMNKFDNQMALIQDRKAIRLNDNITYSVFADIVNNPSTRLEVPKERYEEYQSGDIITYKFKDSSDKKQALLDEKFDKKSIGYKRDLVVSSFDAKNGIVSFENGSDLDISKELYDWNGKKINLNRYRLAYATVKEVNDLWFFDSIYPLDLQKFNFQKGDRIAIGELENTIILYRGYSE